MKIIFKYLLTTSQFDKFVNDHHINFTFDFLKEMKNSIKNFLIVTCGLIFIFNSSCSSTTNNRFKSLHQETYDIIVANNIDNYPQALEKLDELINMDSNDFVAYQNKLYLFALMSNWEAFCDLQDELVYRYPRNGVLLMRSGMCKEYLGDSLNAQSLYKKASEVFEKETNSLESNEWKLVKMAQAINYRLMKDRRNAGLIYEEIIQNGNKVDSIAVINQRKLSRKELFQFMKPDGVLKVE